MPSVTQAKGNPVPQNSRAIRASRSLLLVALVVVSNAVNVFLAHRVRALEQVISALKAEGQLQPGTVVLPFECVGLDGTKQRMEYEGGLPTILYVFSPHCGWCQKNRRNAKDLATQVKGRWNFVGISLSAEGLREFMAQDGFPYPVCAVSADTAKTYKLGGTPTTLLISPDRTVIKVIGGAYTGDTLKEIQAATGAAVTGI
jgi:hypothetical protein